MNKKLDNQNCCRELKSTVIDFVDVILDMAVRHGFPGEEEFVGGNPVNLWSRSMVRQKMLLLSRPKRMRAWQT